MAGQQRDAEVTMACDDESRRGDPRRKAAHHRGCVRPQTCPCPAHADDRPEEMQYWYGPPQPYQFDRGSGGGWSRGA